MSKVWDVCVLLLGATRTRAQLIGDNCLQIENINFLHAAHYRQEIQAVLGSPLNQGAVCPKSIAHLTREEMPPFVRPRELLAKIDGMDAETGFHLKCVPDSCEPDKDGRQRPMYHAPGCSGSCSLIVPPKESIPQFDSILFSQRRMPAVRAYSYLDKRRWWVPVTRKTMAVSHLWRDGISGTRDGGMHECLHHLFSRIAQEQGLDSYWVDCATIPEHPRQRRLMIQHINSTFQIAGFTLCMDIRIAQAKLPGLGTHAGDDSNSMATHQHDEKFLLATITSFWHRRAWTLLEGHKSSDIVFYRESGQHLNLKDALHRVLMDENTKCPLWMRACLAEFEAYMAEGLTPEAAGMLLATRAASRAGDAELIWRLLTQPYTTQVASRAINPNPWHFSDTVDLAFICSNAERSMLPGYCWMPAQTGAMAWARRAHGGIRAEIVRTTNVHLRSKWYAKHGKAVDLQSLKPASQINESSAVQHLKWKLDSRAFDFLFAHPVSPADQGKPPKTDKVIVMTRPCHALHSFGQNILEPLWHWEAMVELGTPEEFKAEHITTLNIGFEHDQTAASLKELDQPPPQSHPPSMWQSADSFFLFLHSFRYPLAVIFIAMAFVHGVAAADPDQPHVDHSGTVSLSYVRLLPPQNIPKIVFEWAALIPLVIYLANGRSNYELAGEVPLRGRLSMSFIPKLFALGGVANLLRLGEVFFDSANNEGESLTVYDVQHGNVFRCYNSAAASLVGVIACRGQHRRPRIISEADLTEWMHSNRVDLEQQFRLARFGDLPGSRFEEMCENRKKYGRWQVLNVIHVMRMGSPGNGKRIRGLGGERGRSRVGYILHSDLWTGSFAAYAEIILTMALAVLLYMAGCLGSGSLVLIGGISRLCAHKTIISRPPQYLWNRENYDKGCMLVAVHENAAAWTLYHGDRGLIDSLLNKPMIDHLKPSWMRIFSYYWFRLAEVLQIIAMTFIAGQKGWDSLVLFALILAVGGFSKLCGYNMHAANWLRREGFETVAFQCEFPGRTELAATVQMLGTEKRTGWMDGIIAPVPRREVLLRSLGLVNCPVEVAQEFYDQLGASDKVWVMSNYIQVQAATALIKTRIERILEPSSPMHKA
ncbi:hypothetical protein ASPCAL00269 [Aspergillus calidoustus]|uniref:Heterokaryon incompatibility domain-containing protein n=1 Tax=Aspergillus calidoustus TaxID=454130 RepID=A0A0U5FUB1_ASPCI|nr:hypothetical protein ASPCAL00269 [Aspergillus calidoustus]